MSSFSRGDDRFWAAADVRLLDQADGHCLVKMVKCRELHSYTDVFYECFCTTIRHLNTICLRGFSNVSPHFVAYGRLKPTIPFMSQSSIMFYL